MKKRQPISLGHFPWIADTVYQLATNSPPPVTVQFREEILAEKVKPEVRELAANWAERREVLDAQEEDGSWQSPAAEAESNSHAFFSTCRRLLELHDLGVRKDHEAVKRAVAYLGKVQQTDGSFPLNVHHTAFTLWILAMYGFGRSAASRKIVKYLEHNRRKDSGWLDETLEPALAANPDSPSCSWTTLHVLLALSEIPDQRANLDVRKGAVLLLDRMFKRNHKSFFGHPDHWRELDYGYEGTACFKWAVPKVLLILGRLGCGPATHEVKDLLEFMKKTLRPSGRWGATAEGNDYLTLRVLRSLMAVQEANG